MKRNRVLFALWLVFWLFIWVFSDTNLGIYIVAASIACAATEVLPAFFAGKHLTVRLAGSATARKKTETSLTAEVCCNGVRSGVKVGVEVRIRNLLTGEECVKTVYTSAERRATAEISFCAEHCGKLDIRAVRLTTYDAFGLFSFSRSTDSGTALLILPELYPVELSVGQQRQPDMDSDEYSMLRSGDDPGETFALREYRPGDKIKNIHWKLSEKIGEPTVRELGLPVNNSLLLLFDNSATDKMPSADMLELLGETAVSVSAALSTMQLAHDIAWLDRERKEISVCHVAGEEDMTAVMSAVLSAETAEEPQTVLERFAEERDLSGFAHILVLSLNGGNTEETVGDTGVVFLSPPDADKEGLYVEI